MMTLGMRPESDESRLGAAHEAAVSSSSTILMTVCPGVRLLSTSWPTARSRTSATKSLTTLKLTSASSSARRISRMAASTSASESRPLPVRFLKTS